MGRFTGKTMWVEANNKYLQAASAIPKYATELRQLGALPRAVWFSSHSGMTVGAVDSLFDKAAGDLLALVAYFRPKKDNGSYSSGGAAPDATAYLAAIDRMVQGMGGRECIVIGEPDCASMMCDRMSSRDRADTGAMLAEANRRLMEGGAHVYQCAGVPNWIPADEIAVALQECGLEHCAGFALNVSNTRSQTELKGYTAAIRAIVGTSKTAVWDTGRNGCGAFDQYAQEPGSPYYFSPNHPDFDDLHWKNSPGRGIGPRPSVNVSQLTYPGVDAFLIIKSPGGSDADDERGHLPPGGFDPYIALDLRGRARPRFPAVPG